MLLSERFESINRPQLGLTPTQFRIDLQNFETGIWPFGRHHKINDEYVPNIYPGWQLLCL